jgi:cytoskeleton protein RodZ
VSFGVSLKRERELRGITLAEIARSTKISVRLLEAIEKDRFDVLPEGVFRKSFIKSYANYLGMNEEQILQEYALEVQPKATTQPVPDKPSTSFKTFSAGSRRSLLLTFGILLVLLGIGWGFWFFTGAGQNGCSAVPATQVTPTPPLPGGQPQSEAIPPATSTAAPVQAQTTTAPPTPTPTTAGQTGSPVNDPSQLKVLGELAKKPYPAPPVGSEGGGPLELTIEANSPSWISVSAGESSLFSGLMSPAETKKFSLDAPLKVTVGNAGGVRLQVGGQVFSSLGKPGERKIFEVSAANYQQYLAPKTP